jgi:hypothetical protein
MNTKTLELFFDLAFMAEQRVEHNKSAYAGFLYKWLELLESFKNEGYEQIINIGRLNPEKLPEWYKEKTLDTEKQLGIINKNLGKQDLSEAQKMTTDIAKTALQLVTEARNYDIHFMPSSFETIVYPSIDEKGNTTFKFKFPDNADPATITGIVFQNLLSIDKLEVKRFQKCPKCGKFFYQYQRKNQKYCSRECTETGRTGRMYKAPETPV